MNPLKTTLLLVVTAWPLAVGGLAAQGVTTAALVGTVTASDSTALEDAVVTVTNTATGERWQTVTRGRGRYVFEYLSVGGPYLLEVRAIGFAPKKGPAMLLSLGERRRADLSLMAAIVRDWAVRRAIPDTRILELVGYDAVNGRGIYVFDTRDPNVRDNEATRWRRQLGARYTF